ncbi:hypothetical protein M5689_013215 [Euphorbia peplus]|nr:hypothetical protein M5689_013215 [Euphorbia peplus]
MANDNEKPLTEASNTSALRRSGRESLNKQSPQSKHSPTPPVQRKSERVEKQTTSPNVLRRSERGKKQSSSSSSGSKKSNRSLDLSVVNKKLQKQKSVKQLTLETKKNSKIEKEVVEPVQKGKDKMNARAYKAIFKEKGKNIVLGVPSKDVNKVRESGEKKVQDLREVSAGKDLKKASEESNCSISKQQNVTLEINLGQDSSCSSQNICALGAPRSEDGDSVKNSEDGHSDVGSGGGNKELSLKRKRDKLDDTTAVGSSNDIFPAVTDAIDSSASGNKLAETCGTCFKRQRYQLVSSSSSGFFCLGSHGANQPEHCLCSLNSDQVTYGAIVSDVYLFTQSGFTYCVPSVLDGSGILSSVVEYC